MKENSNVYLKGRGALQNTPDPFSNLVYDNYGWLPDYLTEGEVPKTKFTYVDAKSIVNKVESPDVGMQYSMNAYQGCEHGCVYCYARNTHPYWGLSAGLDFESKIFVKRNAVELLRKKLSSKRWKAAPIVMSGNTDCYQPIERKEKLTRRLLKTFYRYRHPVGLITKNSMIIRDLDVLLQLKEHNLVRVFMSLNTLDEDLRLKLEPRTASVKNRLKTIATLAKEGIPVGVMVAPVIPGLNDHDVFPLMRTVSIMGASDAKHIVVRLNGDVGSIFEDWVHKAFPDRAEKVLNKIKSCHGGQLNDSRFGVRMKGEGKIAEIIGKQADLARSKFFSGTGLPPLNTEMHIHFKSDQLSLFA